MNAKGKLDLPAGKESAPALGASLTVMRRREMRHLASSPARLRRFDRMRKTLANGRNRRKFQEIRLKTHNNCG
jgi:hypothetical protein